MKNKNKIVDIEERIRKLQEEKEAILKERINYLANYLSKLELASYQDELLLGGLIFLKDVLDNPNSSPEYTKLQEEWLVAGNKFLKRKSKSCKTIIT